MLQITILCNHTDTSKEQIWYRLTLFFLNLYAAVPVTQHASIICHSSYPCIVVCVTFKNIRTASPELTFRRCSYLVGINFHLQRCHNIVSLCTPAFRELLSHTKCASARKSGFGGLEVACWPLVPKFAGSNPAEAVGFFRAKKSSVRLPSEGK